MGEYIEVGGKTLKLGTCENLYYVTFQKLVDMVGRAKKVPGNAAPSEYLTTDWRYRFPFPDEKDNFTTPDDYQRSVNVIIHDEELLKVMEGFEHFGMQTQVLPTMGGNSSGLISATLNIPCPQSKDWKGFPYGKNVVGICQQKSTVEAGGPQLWTVVCCPFCGAKIRLDWAAADKLANAVLRLKGDKDGDFWEGMASSIVAGYLPGNAFELHGHYKKTTTNSANN